MTEGEKTAIERLNRMLIIENATKNIGTRVYISDLKAVLNLVKKQQEEIEQLKASHIITHNKVSDEEKAKLFDVIDNSIDTYLEQTKPYWEQIMIKEKMAIEEAETIIDDMYQDRNKIIETTNEKGVTIHIDRLDDVKFTNLEFASVRALREIQSLRRKLEQKDNDIHRMQELLDISDAKNVKKDKVINEMAKKLNQAYFEENDFCVWFEKYVMQVQEKADYGYVVDLIKQYFENKVEGRK